jgi:hypothetical protein
VRVPQRRGSSSWLTCARSPSSPGTPLHWICIRAARHLVIIAPETWEKQSHPQKPWQDRPCALFGMFVLKKACHAPHLVHLCRTSPSFPIFFPAHHHRFPACSPRVASSMVQSSFQHRGSSKHHDPLASGNCCAVGAQTRASRPSRADRQTTLTSPLFVMSNETGSG